MPPKNPYLNQATKKKILTKMFLPKKIPKSKISTPPKSFDYPCLLTSGVPPSPRPWELKPKKVLKSISYCERKQ